MQTRSDPERVLHKKMKGTPSLETAMPHKSAGIDVDTAAPFHNRILAATAVKKAEKSQAAATELVEDEEKAMKSE